VLNVVQFIRQITPAGLPDDTTDGELLERFIDQRDENAFGTLIRRHGPLVFAVCRRALPTVQDAEDAFQATFLVLARKARSIAKRGSVASWLHGVARRIALRAKADLSKRRGVEHRCAAMVAADCLQELVWQDIRLILDEEVARLPERYRAAFVLCYLEGKTNDEAARLLDCARGTVSSRLVRARAILRARLSRHGLVLSGAFITTMLTRTAASAAVPGRLTASTLCAAIRIGTCGLGGATAVPVQVVTLTQGVLGAMVMGKLKVGALLLSLGLVLTGAGAITLRNVVANPAMVTVTGSSTMAQQKLPDLPGSVQESDLPTAEQSDQPSADPLNRYLRLCEEKLTSLDSFLANVTRTSVDKTFQVTEVYEGTVKYLKPEMSMREMHKQGDSKVVEKYILTGKRLYEYCELDKEIRVREVRNWIRRESAGGLAKRLDRLDSQIFEPVIFPFSPFMKIDESKRLYKLNLTKEDRWYIYVDVQPRSRESKDDFRRGRVVLSKPTYLPRQIWFELPNGHEVKWDILRIEENVHLARNEFTAPRVPPGWKMRQMP
jgi:TIGR03009 family protein